jgi:L-malate glycosyltransferase
MSGGSKRPVRICYVIGSLERCGTSVHLLGFLRHLDRTRWDPWVVGLGEPGAIGEAIRKLGVEVDQYNLRTVYSREALRIVSELSGKIRRSRTRIVQSYLFIDNIIATLAGRLGGARAIITGRRTVDDWESARHIRLYRLTNRWVQSIAVVSSEVAESVRRLEGAAPERIRLIRNAQSRETLLARSDPAEDALLNELDSTLDGGFVFGSVGNIRPIKGHDVLVHAFRRVVARHPDAHLVLVGGIYPGPPHIEQLIEELGLSHSIHLVGYRANVAGFVERFSAFVLPSLAEGMSNALLEALLMGKPAIATTFGLPKTAEGRDVVLGVEPGDPDALAAAMESMIEDAALRRRLSEAALEYAAGMDEGQMVRQYEALYEELLASPARGAIEPAGGKQRTGQV